MKSGRGEHERFKNRGLKSTVIERKAIHKVLISLLTIVIIILCVYKQ